MLYILTFWGAQIDLERCCSECCIYED